VALRNIAASPFESGAMRYREERMRSASSVPGSGVNWDHVPKRASNVTLLFGTIWEIFNLVTI